MNYKDIEKRVITVLEKTPICVFATADKNGVVTAAQMCLINDGLKVYVQTDATFEKVKNIRENPHVAINCGAYYFKGKAKIVGHPSINPVFIEKIKQKHLSTYNHYTNLPSEVLIEVELTEGRIWGIDAAKDVASQETVTIVDFKNKTTKTIICDKL